MIPSYLRKLSSASWGGNYVKWKKFYSVKLGYETFPGIYLIIRHGIFFPTQIFRLIRNFSFRVSTNESRVLRLQLEFFRVLPLSFDESVPSTSKIGSVWSWKTLAIVRWPDCRRYPTGGFRDSWKLRAISRYPRVEVSWGFWIERAEIRHLTMYFRAFDRNRNRATNRIILTRWK